MTDPAVVADPRYVAAQARIEAVCESEANIDSSRSTLGGFGHLRFSCSSWILMRGVDGPLIPKSSGTRVGSFWCSKVSMLMTRYDV